MLGNKNNQNKISLEQSLKAYQVMHAPSKFSWKQHWAQEKFSSPDMLSCTIDEQEQFAVIWKNPEYKNFLQK